MKGDRYNTSKLLVILLARELAKSMDQNGNNNVVVNTLNPGFCRSSLFRSVPFPVNWIIKLAGLLMGRTCEMGSRTLVAAAAAGPESHGRYMNSCVVGQESLFVTSEEGARAQKRVYAELMAILEGIVPGITKSL